MKVWISIVVDVVVLFVAAMSLGIYTIMGVGTVGAQLFGTGWAFGLHPIASVFVIGGISVVSIATPWLSLSLLDDMSRQSALVVIRQSPAACVVVTGLLCLASYGGLTAYRMLQDPEAVELGVWLIGVPVAAAAAVALGMCNAFVVTTRD